MGLLNTATSTTVDGLLAVDSRALAERSDADDMLVLPVRLFTDLHRANSLYQVAEAILRWIPAVIVGDRWSMAIERDETSIEIVTIGEDGGLVSGQQRDRTTSLIGLAFDQGDRALVCDLTARDEPDARQLREEGHLTAICHTVVHRGRVVAAVNCASRAADAYEIGDVIRLRALAELAGFHLAVRDRLDEAERLASLDPLTGTANRRAYVDWLEERLAVPDGPPFALGLLDLDHFKTVNDTFGHQAGDRVLVRVAECLQAAVRDADLVARFGGEEFALLIDGADARIAAVVFARVLDRLRQLRLPDADDHMVTASIGGAVRRPTDATERDIFERADAAVYRAKGEGRDRVVMAD